MLIITTIPKQGNSESFIHKPVISQGKAIGIIKEIHELPYAYELMIWVWDKFVDITTEFEGDNLSALSIKTK